MSSSPWRLLWKLAGRLAANPWWRVEDMSEMVGIRCNAHLEQCRIHVSLCLLGCFVGTITLPRRKREGHTIRVDPIYVFLDLLFCDAVLEDYDEG